MPTNNVETSLFVFVRLSNERFNVRRRCCCFFIHIIPKKSCNCLSLPLFIICIQCCCCFAFVFISVCIWISPFAIDIEWVQKWRELLSRHMARTDHIANCLQTTILFHEVRKRKWQQLWNVCCWLCRFLFLLSRQAPAIHQSHNKISTVVMWIDYFFFWKMMLLLLMYSVELRCVEKTV